MPSSLRFIIRGVMAVGAQSRQQGQWQQVVAAAAGRRHRQSHGCGVFEQIWGAFWGWPFRPLKGFEWFYKGCEGNVLLIYTSVLDLPVLFGYFRDQIRENS